MKRRTLIEGMAAATLSGIARPAGAVETESVRSPDEVAWVRYAAKRTGPRPSVLVLHGSRGFELKLPAYERYANALTNEGIDAYLVTYYAAHDSAALRAMGTSREREAYETQRYDAWVERVSSVVTTILKSQGESKDGSSRIGLLGFSLGGFVAAATAARDARVSALAVLYGGMPEKFARQVKRMPPVIELHGDSDRNVPPADGAALVALAKSVGASAEHVTFPGKAHGFDFAEGDPAARDALERVIRFFRAQLGAA